MRNNYFALQQQPFCIVGTPIYIYTLYVCPTGLRALNRDYPCVRRGTYYNNVITSPEVDSVRVKLFNLTVGQFFGSGGSAYYNILWWCNCCFVYNISFVCIYVEVRSHNAWSIWFGKTKYMYMYCNIYYYYDVMTKCARQVREMSGPYRYQTDREGGKKVNAFH